MQAQGCYNKHTASVVKLVDTMDSKSIAFTGVAVRVRPLAPDLQTYHTSPPTP